MHQVKEKLIKKLKGVRKLCSILSKHSLLVIYKSFVRPNLDYGDVINESFCKKTESLQYQAWLAISGTSSKMLKELGFKSLKCRRGIWRLCIFIKIIRFEISKYLHNIISLSNQHNTRLKVVICEMQFADRLCFFSSDLFKHFFVKFANQKIPSFRIFVFKETTRFLFILQAQQLAYILLLTKLNCTLFSCIWIAFLPQIFFLFAPDAQWGSLQCSPYPLKDLSKQFWCPLYGTKNSILHLSFETQSSYIYYSLFFA